ncbi:alpha-D-ribose 1-methylphosphonate 5-triphosphate diphosphatase [Aureimonas pseudogalii]|uniref:Alpha-D-ribose 1-methylphosphonate 5-triphosphate diphosphatase n=1 Tax=Aureimonas pseudogalii TaxID=1744844 RepID=A0A7W6H4Y5_9HYPH|nr:alpha-D-ribose 1-methylphosphonate 5-triphosphate diphosphatase [Aureimonas pseudogalii]MBB3998645.1 alpha-D-ribose 1-methylphosphonate 5-triphosphate diphosphatase [Aureimonas pseudogalii]
MTEQIFRNASIVLDREVVRGSLVVRDGRIAAMDDGMSSLGVDLDGDVLIPGLVELHTDHLEGHYLPRPKVRWNMMAALQAHDAQVAASGITTVFDALRVGMDEDAHLDSSDMRAMADTIEAASVGGRLRAEHFIHLRCEVSAPDVLDAFEAIAGGSRIRLASLMDHAPGQRQFVDLDTYRSYYQRKMKMTDVEFEAFCRRRIGESQAHSEPNRRAIAARCHADGIAVASHDDATADHVREGLEIGISLAEFPTTIEAARLSHEAGLKVLMGAPNIVRGGSHSGNVSAAELLASGTLDILSSDYVPFSLVQSAFHLADGGAIDLPGAIRLVSTNPAEAAGLHDRGRIEIGRRADLVRVRKEPDQPPLVLGVWREGARVC